MSVYYIPLGSLTVTNDADQDIWELLAPSDAAVVIHWAKLTSTMTSDERVYLRLVRRTGAGSGGGLGLVEVPARGTEAAVGTSVIPLVTTPGTAGDILLTDVWSQLAPWELLPTPETRIGLVQLQDKIVDRFALTIYPYSLDDAHLLDIRACKLSVHLLLASPFNPH